jgi:hypothetical protein
MGATESVVRFVPVVKVRPELAIGRDDLRLDESRFTFQYVVCVYMEPRVQTEPDESSEYRECNGQSGAHSYEQTLAK